MWQFGDHLANGRLRYLSEEASFEQICAEMLSSARFNKPAIRRGKGKCSGLVRPVFAVDISKRACDRFFNHSHGYRGEYFTSVTRGNGADRRVRTAFLCYLLAAIPTKRTRSIPWEASLLDENAKVWIWQGRWMRPNGLNVEILNGRWEVCARRAYAAYPIKKGRTDCAKLKIWGARAPIETTIEIKGAWFDPRLNRMSRKCKPNRGVEVMKYGFT